MSKKKIEAWLAKFQKLNLEQMSEQELEALDAEIDALGEAAGPLRLPLSTAKIDLRYWRAQAQLLRPPKFGPAETK